MKIATLILATLNSLPLILYLFIAVPLYRILQMEDPFGEGLMNQFFGYGFCWATLLYPLVLLFNHGSSFRNFKRGQIKSALWNQIAMGVYVLALIVYGSLTFMIIESI